MTRGRPRVGRWVLWVSVVSLTIASMVRLVFLVFGENGLAQETSTVSGGEIIAWVVGLSVLPVLLVFPIGAYRTRAGLKPVRADNPTALVVQVGIRTDQLDTLRSLGAGKKTPQSGRACQMVVTGGRVGIYTRRRWKPFLVVELRGEDMVFSEGVTTTIYGGFRHVELRVAPGSVPLIMFLVDETAVWFPRQIKAAETPRIVAELQHAVTASTTHGALTQSADAGS